MNIQLIEGQFSTKDAFNIITQMMHVKIKYHEEKIQHSANEEDIKMRETKIKSLQKNIFEVRNYLDHAGNIHINSEINLKL